ncbi:MAG TPA: glycoside hydrolase family 9 protein [Victivallales bacterium]|nr:glycoside hydrolase family 9 protein [Victivallales bacterium]
MNFLTVNIRQFLLGVLIILCSVAVVNAGEPVTFRVVNAWNDGYQASVVISNNTNVSIEGWTVEFDYPYSINDIWNAEISEHSNNHYVINNVSHNGMLNSGQSTEFGFVASSVNGSELPQNIVFYDKSINNLEEENTEEDTDETTEEINQNIVFNLIDSWKNGYIGEFTLTNISDKPTVNWKVEFDLQDKITNIWNTEIVSDSENNYIVKNEEWNPVINSNSTITFGFQAEGSYKGDPYDVKVHLKYDIQDNDDKDPVLPDNKPPVANNDEATTNINLPVVISVLANDFDLDSELLVITDASSPNNGSIIISVHDIKYQPDRDFTGYDQFTYTISDGNGGTGSAQVNVRVNNTVNTENNYATALQKAIYFYDCQRAGYLPKYDGDLASEFHNGFLSNRVEWRGDSYIEDGKYGHNGEILNLDLNGGWFDAGDHVKFGLPMAFSASVFGWSIYEFKDAYEKSNQLKYALDNLRWISDYFLKAHTGKNELFAQVGNGVIDHTIWAPPEVQWLKYKELHGSKYRPAVKLTMNNPGADLVAQTSAALCISSLVFRENGENEYADELIRHAKELFEFAYQTKDVNNGRYTPSLDFGDYAYAVNFYNAGQSGASDEIPWAAGWLYLATKDQVYLNIAETNYTAIADNTGHFAWYPSWDDIRNGVYFIMEKIALTPEYQLHSQVDPAKRANGYNNYESHSINYVNHLLNNAKYTPGGMIYLDGFASARAAGMAAYSALVHRNYLKTANKSAENQNILRNFAKAQIDYILGYNSHSISYMVGYGSKWQLNAHHRSSHGSTTNDINAPELPKHILYGGLAGGPDQYDNYSSDRADFPMTEVATDMNAGLTGALAGLADIYGGVSLENFPLPEIRDDEVFCTAKINSTQEGSKVSIRIFNNTAYPPRGLSDIKFRYFVVISDELSRGLNIEQIEVETYYNSRQTGNVNKSLNKWNNSIYYVEGSFTGAALLPVSDSDGKAEMEIYIRGPWNGTLWDGSTDYSAVGLKESVYLKTKNIAVYNGESLIWGNEP